MLVDITAQVEQRVTCKRHLISHLQLFALYQAMHVLDAKSKICSLFAVWSGLGSAVMQTQHRCVGQWTPSQRSLPDLYPQYQQTVHPVVSSIDVVCKRTPSTTVLPRCRTRSSNVGCPANDPAWTIEREHSHSNVIWVQNTHKIQTTTQQRNVQLMGTVSVCPCVCVRTCRVWYLTCRARKTDRVHAPKRHAPQRHNGNGNDNRQPAVSAKVHWHISHTQQRRRRRRRRQHSLSDMAHDERDTNRNTRMLRRIMFSRPSWEHICTYNRPYISYMPGRHTCS